MPARSMLSVQDMLDPEKKESGIMTGLRYMESVLGGSFIKRGDEFINPDPVEWMLEHFFIPETENDPVAPFHIKLADYQQDALWQALTPDEDGNYPYSVVVWSDIKKSIKSTIAAGVVLWLATNTPWASIKIVANDLKQADSRVSFYVRRAIQLNPKLAEICHMVPSGYFIEFLHNHARIEAIPVDPKGEAGGNDDMVVFSELWAANNTAAKKLWTETTLSPTKFGKSFRWVETYAGYSGESPTLEMLYQQGVKEGRRLEWAEDYDPPLEIYENKVGRMLVMWNQTPRLEWQTPEYYGQEAAVLTSTEFTRVHRNSWVSSVNIFVPIEWWDRSRRDGIMERLSMADNMVMALDAGVSSDSFGVVMVSGLSPDVLKILRDADGKSDDTTYLAVRYARNWIPRKGEKLDFEPIENEINRLLSEYNVIEIAYDPYQLHDMAGRIKKGLKAHVREFGQAGPRLRADKALFDMIRDRRMLHDGSFPELREHVMNANAESDKEGNRLRIIKRAEHLKIDMAVCLSMAADRASHWQI